MKNRGMVSVALLLLLSPFAFAQTSRSKSATAANQSWLQFWRGFSAAINKKDREGLKKNDG